MRIMTIPCDGIGPEIVAATLDVIEVANKGFNLDISLQEEAAGLKSLANHGITLREEVLDRARSDFDDVLLVPSHIWTRTLQR